MKKLVLTLLALLITVGLLALPALPVGEYVPFLQLSEVRAQEPVIGLGDFTIVFNPTGTHVKDGNLKIRLDFYPREGSKTYELHHIQVPIFPYPEEPLGGYPGEVDKDGLPLDINDYNLWVDHLPKEWQLNPALCHFVIVPKDVDAEKLYTFINTTFTPDVTATIDDALIQENSIHLISPFMRDKSLLEKEAVAIWEKETVISSVNDRLTDFFISGEGGGEVLDIQPKSITVGDASIDRTSTLTGTAGTRTMITLGNPSSGTGSIDTIKIWLNSSLNAVIAGTFANTSGTTYQCNDLESIGTPASGSEQTISGLDISINSGEFIGCNLVAVADQMERSTSGESGAMYIDGEYIDPSDSASYSSLAANAFSINGTGEEAGGVVAPTVTSDNSSLVEETTATLSGNITATGGANCTERGFEWGTSTGAYTANQTTGGNFGVGIFNENITGLTKGELYYWRALAVNSAGAGYGSEKTFLTKPDAPDSLSATGLDTQVNLTWNLGTGADNTTVRGLIGDYPADYSANTSVYDGPAASANHTGLVNGDHWYYRAWSWCTEGGLEKWSDAYSQADATPLAVPTVTSDNSTLVEETTATLAGNITDVGGANADERGFEWGTSTGVYADNSTTSDNYSTGIYSANITGLTEGELYFWRAMAHNTSGWGYGGELTFLTKPLAPTSFTATASGDEEVTLAWSKGTGADNTTITRKIDSYPTDRADGVNVYDDTGTGHIDTDNISAGTAYYYRAWSWCTEGALVQYSDTYGEDNATAYAVVAPTVTSSNATSVTHNSATLSGNITDTGNENPSLRGFEWGVGSGNYTDNWTGGGSFPTGAFSHGITGLSANTTYCWRAFAENSAGFGYSGELCFTTSVTPPPPPPAPFDLEAGVYLMIRPDLDEAIVRANGKPTHVNVGIFDGYSLPIYNNDDEELFFNTHVPQRWNGNTDIFVHMIVSIASAEDNKIFNLECAWEHLTPGVDVVPVTSHSVTVETNTGPSVAQYQTYYPHFRLDYDIDSPDIVEFHDDLALRVRRLAASANETTDEIIIHHLGVMFMRGDLLGDPDIVLTEDDMEVLAGPLETLGTGMTSFMYLLVVALFGILAFWKLSAPLFMVAAGVSFMTGLYWYDAYTTNMGLTVGLMLVACGLVCIGFAFRCIFWKGEITDNRG